MEKLNKINKLINKIYYNLFIENFRGKIKNNFPENIIRVSDLPASFPKYTPESQTNEIESPTYAPESPTYAPESPTYGPESPTYGPESQKYAKVIPDLNLDTGLELEEEELNEENLDDVKNDEDKEKIIKTESSIDKQDTTGLEKLSTIDESEKNEDEETSSDIKSITR